MGEAQFVDDSLPLILLGIVGMFVLAGAVILFFLVYQRRLFSQRNKMRDLELAHQKDLLKSFIEAQEQERARVANDLHDGVGSLLSAIRLYLLHLSPQGPVEEVDQVLTETKSIVDTAISQTREISHDLLPTSLERFGALHAMEDHCNRIQRLNGIQMAFKYDREFEFDKQQDLALYRILQELTQNTLKHAEASEIEVGLIKVGSEIQFFYKDNGKGMALEGREKGNEGLGMKSIESRANLLKGKTEIQSAPEEGFSFALRFPV